MVSISSDAEFWEIPIDHQLDAQFTELALVEESSSQQGADCNAPASDSKGVTALQAAAIGGHLPIAVMLLKAGANINAPAAEISGRGALEAAAEHGRLDIVSLLLENETDIDGLESRCESAAKLAERNGHIFIARMLRGYKKE